MLFRSPQQLLTLVVLLLTVIAVVLLAGQLLSRPKSDAAARTSADAAPATQQKYFAL